MTTTTMNLAELLEKQDDGDFLRSVAKAVLQLIMEADVEGVIGAGRHERSEGRTTWRDGYRDRPLDTRLGTLNLRVPKRQGSCFPGFMEPRRTSEKALVAVIQKAWTGGVSARRVDELVQAMGQRRPALVGPPERKQKQEHGEDDGAVAQRRPHPSDASLEYIPESHGADDKRVDIIVQAAARLILPVEIKGQWHRDLWTNADAQLDHLCVSDWRAERGILLVLWFGDAVALTRSPAGIDPSSTPQELREALRVTSRAAQAGRVDIVVLDLTRPEPNSSGAL